MNKALRNKIIISIICIIVLVGTLIGFKVLNNNKAESAGVVIVEVIDIDGNIKTKSIEYFEGDTLLSILDKNYTLRYENGIYGVVIYDIDEIKTDFIHNYISIYIDDVYSNYSLSSIKLYDGMKVTLKELAI